MSPQKWKDLIRSFSLSRLHRGDGLVGAGIIPDTTQYALLTSSTTGLGADGSIFSGITVDAQGVISGLTLVVNDDNGNPTNYYANSYFKLVSNGSGYNIDIEIVPEPGTWALLFLGC